MLSYASTTIFDEHRCRIVDLLILLRREMEGLQVAGDNNNCGELMIG